MGERKIMQQNHTNHKRSWTDNSTVNPFSCYKRSLSSSNPHKRWKDKSPTDFPLWASPVEHANTLLSEKLNKSSWHFGTKMKKSSSWIHTDCKGWENSTTFISRSVAFWQLPYPCCIPKLKIHYNSTIFFTPLS